jgi:hypothetical protein
MHEQFGSGAWKALEAHAATNRTLQPGDLFAEHPKRRELLAVDAAGGQDLEVPNHPTYAIKTYTTASLSMRMRIMS